MADGKLTDFTAATTTEATDKMYLVRNGVDLYITLSTLLANIPSVIKTQSPIYLGGTPQSLAGAGLITVTQTTTEITNTSSVGLTINDGLFDGHVKIILTTSATGVSTLTGANLAVTSIAFDQAGKTMLLFWRGTKWWPLSGTATITY